jgi:hypothetical protein
MTKSDLKTGMVCKHMGGFHSLILGNACVVLDANKGGVPLYNFTKDLHYIHKENQSFWDIVEVYGEREQASGSDMMFKIANIEYIKGDLLWKCEDEPVEMTMEEICKALGKNIKIIK